jgi:hypothetical protein
LTDILMLALEGLIAPPLKALGFKKRARTWWRHRDATIQVLNLQKSSFGERLYVKLGVYVKALGAEGFPLSNAATFRYVLNGLRPKSAASALHPRTRSRIQSLS